MIQEIHSETNKKMESCIQHYRKVLSGIRTGRANTAILDNLRVEYYGNKTPLNQIANLSVPDSHTINIQAWDVSNVPVIEKAIQTSDLGLTPSNDGKIIRISIPPLTEERRKQLIKVVKKEAEECKIAIRNVRRDMMEQLKLLEKDGDIAKDDHKKAQDETQKVTNSFISKTDEITSKKEKELLEQ